MFYLIYKITNTLNHKVYIGSHKTKNKNDGYMGSGKYLLRAIAKHGIEKFTKEILFEFDSAPEMYVKEAELVNENFLTDENTYNLKLGGFGGFDYINSKKLNRHEANGNFTSLSGAIANQAKDKLFAEHPEIKEKWAKHISTTLCQNNPRNFLGRKHTDETKRKMSENARKRLSIPANNSQLGTMWITNETESAKIKKDSPVPEGWRKGRKMPSN